VGAAFPGPIASTAGRLGRALGTGLLPLLLVGCSGIGTMRAQVQEGAVLDGATAGSGYQAGGTLGFTLQQTAIAEQLERRTVDSERGLLWSAHFRSRWPLTEDQLDRWSAQVIGLIADGLGADVRLAGWERLEATDIGERRVAYRYTLTTASADETGEATVVVFARGERVGLTGAAAMGSRRSPAGRASAPAATRRRAGGGWRTHRPGPAPLG
jgi:hypothetical protein